MNKEEKERKGGRERERKEGGEGEDFIVVRY